MTPEFFLKIINLGAGEFVKIALLLIIFLYAVFAAVVTRQVQLMNKVINQVKFSDGLMFLALLHFLAAVVLFFIVLITL